MHCYKLNVMQGALHTTNTIGVIFAANMQSLDIFHDINRQDMPHRTALKSHQQNRKMIILHTKKLDFGAIFIISLLNFNSCVKKRIYKRIITK